MTTYKFATPENFVVLRFDDGVCRVSCSILDPTYLAWLAEGNTPEPADQPDPTAIEAQRIQALWQAAHDYEYAQVSGSAIGLLAMGVMQAKPKCVAVQNWIKSIWNEYYVRKANGSTDTDYSFAGPCPYTVPELMAELGL